MLRLERSSVNIHIASCTVHRWRKTGWNIWSLWIENDFHADTYRKRRLCGKAPPSMSEILLPFAWLQTRHNDTHFVTQQERRGMKLWCRDSLSRYFKHPNSYDLGAFIRFDKKKNYNADLQCWCLHRCSLQFLHDGVIVNCTPMLI